MGHTHRYQFCLKKKKKGPSPESRVPKTGSDPPIGSGRDSGRDKIAEEGIVNLNATWSAIIQQKLPAKMDPSSFTIPCSIGKYEFKKALCDFCTSINLMALLVVQRLNLGELTPTTITLQMADIIQRLENSSSHWILLSYK